MLVRSKADLTGTRDRNEAFELVYGSGNGVLRFSRLSKLGEVSPLRGRRVCEEMT